MSGNPNTYILYEHFYFTRIPQSAAPRWSSPTSQRRRCRKSRGRISCEGSSGGFAGNGPCSRQKERLPAVEDGVGLAHCHTSAGTGDVSIFHDGVCLAHPIRSRRVVSASSRPARASRVMRPSGASRGNMRLKRKSAKETLGWRHRGTAAPASAPQSRVNGHAKRRGSCISRSVQPVQFCFCSRGFVHGSF